MQLLGAYKKECQVVLKHLHSDPVDMGGLWLRAEKLLEQNSEKPWSNDDKETVRRWFWEEDLPMAMSNLYQSGDATSRSGDPTFTEVWRGLDDQQRKDWSHRHWLGVWSLFCGIKPESRDGSDNRPGGITFQIAHRMPWDWMHFWWSQKTTDIQNQLLVRKIQLADYFERPPSTWQKIDNLGERNNPKEMESRHRVWQEWWELGVAMYPTSASPFVQGEVREGLKRTPEVMSQNWYAGWLNSKKPEDPAWWVDGVLALHATEKREKLERTLDALKSIMTESRRLALSEALANRLGKNPESDAAIERWALSLGKLKPLEVKPFAL
jgi:hypothetical protein